MVRMWHWWWCSHYICRIQLLWRSYNVTPISRWMASTTLVVGLTIFVVFNSYDVPGMQSNWMIYGEQGIGAGSHRICHIQLLWRLYIVTSNWRINGEHGVGDGSHCICRIQLLWRSYRVIFNWMMNGERYIGDGSHRISRIQLLWCSYNAASNWLMNGEHGVGDGSHHICRIQLLLRSYISRFLDKLTNANPSLIALLRPKGEACNNMQDFLLVKTSRKLGNYG